MDAVRIALACALPWVAGAGLLASLATVDRAQPVGAAAWRVGCGWFVGIFVATLVLRVQSRLGVPFGLGSSGVALAMLAVLALVVPLRARRVHARGVWQALAGRDLTGWRRIAWWALLAWVAIRFGMLLAEVVWRPMYPWDAWAQWATKARVWFGVGAMAPFVSEPEWLQATTAGVYFDHAPRYPATVPLMQTWIAIALGRWDDALVNVPWWVSGVAFGIAVFGFLREQGFDPLAALVATWLALSLPVLDAHIALAGYADLPMATFFTLGALAALRAVRSRSRVDAAVAVVLLVACVTIKNPGRVWVATLVPAILVARWPDRARRIAALTLGVALLLVLVLARLEPVILGYRLQLSFALPWSSLADAYLFFGNWHLLWYAVVAVALLGVRHLLGRELAPMTMVVGAGAMFLLLGFTLTNAGIWVEDQSTVNRATLHLAPLCVIWMVLVFREWSARTAPGAFAVTTAPAHAD